MSAPSVVIPWPTDWSEIYGLDNGGPIATETALSVISDLANAGAMGVSAGGIHSEWLKPVIATSGYETIANITWAGVFTPGSVSYLAYDTDEERYAAWSSYMNLEITTWLPDILFVDQEAPYGNKPTMPAEIRAALDAAGLTGTPAYWYKGDTAFVPGTGSAPAPSYYYQLGTATGMWKAADVIGSLRTRMADADNSIVDGYPWVSFYIQASALGEGLVGDVRDVVNFCRILREGGALGIHNLFPPYCDPVGGLNGANNTQLLEYMQAAAEVWGPSPRLTPKR